MSIVVPTVALSYILNTMLNRTLKLRLCSNDIIPDASTTLSSFTEVIGGGYSEIDLLAADLTVVDDLASWPQQTFTFTNVPTGPSTVYCAYIVDPLNPTFIWAERFSESVLPFNPVAGSTIKITPRLQN
jgi:hypothetical protein